MIPRALGWLVILVALAAILVALSQPHVPGALFLIAAVFLVVGVAIAFGAFDHLPDEDEHPQQVLIDRDHEA